MSKAIQLVLVLFVFGIVAAVPFLLGNAIFPTASAQQITALGNAAPTGNAVGAQIVNGVQEISIRASPQGYSPSFFTVRKGVPVKILFSADKYAGCGRQFIMRDFGVNAIVTSDAPVEITFTPTQEGSFPYRCSMNMFRGTMTVTA